ncbi:hypothetical protein J7E83_17790 [Arthrobacter sp. ISL-48]|uniref:hypothetical protein n=1 Tax=Arthrobacter sp. ISL-48 TaxID=2819110 RepID=UPI001BE70767|nr:hypothetical protein [Arthrobacter sp. ISL-48]MBT2533943.1 hypothetical protein [Arthrobacter sp. ISL-48]
MPYYVRGELMTSHPEFTNEVSKYSTTSLLELIGLVCAKYATWEEWTDPSGGNPPPPSDVSPWALAHIARTAILHRNERKRVPEARDLIRLCGLYVHIKEPVLAYREEADALLRLGIRLTQEQLPYQTDPSVDLARMGALLCNTRFPMDRTPKFFTPGWDEQILGMPLKNYMNMIYTLWAFAVTNKGQFRLQWLNEPQHQFLADYFQVDSAHGPFKSDWSLHIEDFPAANEALAQSVEDGYRKYEVNPLWTRPFVGLPDGRFIAPVSQLIVRKASPTGIFYSVPEARRNQFAVELGYLFEEYVGDNLRLIPGADVIKEIMYNHIGNQGSCAD